MKLGGASLLAEEAVNQYMERMREVKLTLSFLPQKGVSKKRLGNSRIYDGFDVLLFIEKHFCIALLNIEARIFAM